MKRALGALSRGRHGGRGFFVKLAAAVCLMGSVTWAAQAQFNWAAMQAHPWLRGGALFL